MPRWVTYRTSAVATCAASVLAITSVLLTAGPHAEPQTPAPQTPAPQPERGQPGQPTFRLGASYIRVDVYPTRDGEPVQNLERGDFDLLEDGVPQKIEQFERVSIQSTLDRTSRRDPNTVAEARDQAADPRRRVFVVFLDTGMTTVEGSHAARKPIVDMLDRLIGDDDLFAVMTPDMAASGITFARRTESLDAELSKYWTWGQRDALVRRDPEEITLQTCFPDPAPEQWCPGLGGKLVKQPADAYRGVAAQLIERRNEDRVLSALHDLVSYVGAVREERKAVIVVSQGWRLLEAKFALTKLQTCEEPPRPGPPGVTPGGRLVPDSSTARTRTGLGSSTECHALAMRYADIDSPSQFRQLVERANRFNVSFYPFDTRGLAVFDRSMSVRDDAIRKDPGEMSERRRGVRGPLTADVDRAADRVSSLRTLAESTDGLAVVNTNDLAGGARRIVNDLSTYYLLGYQSTNTTLDGRWRAITVKVKTPGIRVRARRGYRALTEEEMSLMRRGGAPSTGTGTPTAGGDAAGAAGAASLAHLVDGLAGLDRLLPWRSRAAWTTGPTAGSTHLWIASDIADATLQQPEWADGGTLTATVSLVDGTRLADTTVKLPPGGRTLDASLDAAIPPSTEVMVRLRLSPAKGGLPLSDTLRVTPSGTTTRLFRRGPSSGRLFVAAGEPKFRRSEHARVALPIADPTAVLEATLLDRAGKPLAVPVAARTETIDGGTWALAEVSLAPLSPADYVIRLVVGRGDAASTTLTAIRLVN